MSTPHTAANSDARKRAARAEVQPGGDVEALAEVLLGSWAMQSMLTPPFDSDRDDARTDARAVLASDWLAAHDERVRREAEAALADLRARVEALADGIKAGTADFMAGFDRAGEGISTRMSGETAAMVVMVRSEMESHVRALLAQQHDGGGE